MKLWPTSFSIHSATSPKRPVWMWLYLPDKDKVNLHKAETYFIMRQHLFLAMFTPHKVAFLIFNCKFQYIFKNAPEPLLSFSTESYSLLFNFPNSGFYAPISPFKSLFHTSVSLCWAVAPSLRATAGTQSLKCSST